CGVEAFTGKGQLLRAGGRVLKNATDQILLQLLCGSEGILGIFSQLTLRLLKKPLKTYWIIAPFKNIDDIAPVALKILSHPLLDPTMIEIMDALTLFCAEKFSGESLGFPDYNHLMVRFDGNDPQSVENFASITGEICMDAGAEDVLAAESASEQTRLWKIRSGTHEAIQNVIGSVCEEDVVVPIAAAGAMIIEARKISSDFDLPLAIFGHLGDGNLHINYSRKDPLDESPLPVDKLKDRIFAAATSLGGKISGEHGIGITKSKWFIKHADPVYLSTLKKIKATLDPENIINPGKIIP
ncbi:MAG: FAD-binding oxidoreductase, partial [Elusimicrobia bacterium]|nr:FAD-binding oxidoreductase [Elusimicrobiota bacterium]